MKKVGLIIVDGLGVNNNKHGNAFALAKTPTFDSLLKQYPHSLLQASELAVGLPQGQMGNSEIGHLNIGAGRTIRSELVRINMDIDNNKFAKNQNLLKAIDLALNNNVTFHVIGLTSDGGVHAQLAHIFKVLEVCAKKKVKTVLHCLTDGRDAPVKAFARYLPLIQIFIAKNPNIKLGSIGGRYYGMDRNQNWDRIEKALNAFVHESDSFTSASDHILDNYDKKITDEFIVPAYTGKDTEFKNNDIIFIANYRPDRVRQLCHCIKKSNLYKYESKLWPLNLKLVTMVKYDGIDSDIVIYPPEQYPNTLGKVLEDNGLKQLRIAETEKYAHVTFFFDGGKELNYKNEQKILVNSPDVATYDLKPEMSAYEVTDKLLANMSKFDVFICNFANCDMVGHTGNLDATIKAVEAVDTCLSKIIAKSSQLGITLFITADHGNCDCMLDSSNKPITTHSLNPVWFISTDKSLTLKNGSLANIAPTIIRYLGIKKPKEMDKESLY